MSEGPASDGYFLSYSRSDERFALRLARDLRADGVDMWVDQLDIRPSEHWDRAIERAVRGCRGLVVILSPRSVASDNVADEISYAIDSGKSVLPVMIEKCVLPLRITRMHLIDATGRYDKALKQCLTELKQADGCPASSENASVSGPASFDPEVLSAARQRLAGILGPIAGILVDKAAARAASAAELYSLLSLHIDDDEERGRFAATSPQHSTPAPAPVERAEARASASPVAPSELEAIATVLTSYLGPIAPLVAKREGRSCNSVADLRQRLAALIPVEKDRSEFLRQVSGR